MTQLRGWKIEPHDSYDKSFRIDGPLPLIIDNDDVDHGAVEVLAERLVDALNAFGIEAPSAKRCENEDCESYWHTKRIPQFETTPFACEACGRRATVFEVTADA